MKLFSIHFLSIFIWVLCLLASANLASFPQLPLNIQIQISFICLCLFLLLIISIAVECGWQAKLTETNEKHEQELARVRCDLSTMHLDELQSVRAQHQKAIDELNERLNLLTAQMAEQTIEYEVKMKESESARNRRLNDELASLQFALQLKNEAVQKLRCENRELIIQTEKIAEKDAQIAKFGKKNEDLNEEVNRLKQIEKNLISQLNEFRRELDETRAKCKEMGMEREVLEYQLQEQIERGSHSTTPLSTPKMSKYHEFSPHGSRSSHHYVNIRTPDSQQKSTGRPNSSCWPSQGRPIEFEGDMSKSMDSAMSQSVISCYRQEGRSKSQNTPNKIYTPREFYEANDSSPFPPPTSAAKRIVDFQDCGVDDGTNDNDNVDDNQTKALLDPAAEAK